MAVVSVCSTFSGTRVSTGTSVSRPVAASDASTSSRALVFFSAISRLSRPQCYRGICSWRTRAMKELVEDKELKENTSFPRREAVIGSNKEVEVAGRFPSFLNARSEELLCCIGKEGEKGKVPLNVAMGMQFKHFYDSFSAKLIINWQEQRSSTCYYGQRAAPSSLQCSFCPRLDERG